MRFRREVVFLLASLVVLAILLVLGTWQLERREWKDALIARIVERSAAEPASIAGIERRRSAGEDVEFMRTSATGRFLNERELYLFTTRGGVTGWQVVTPLETADGQALLVDRGFVPAALKDPARRPGSQPEDFVTVTGVARLHAEGPGFFSPDNDPFANLWYWWSPPEMAKAAGVESAATFILQAEAEPGSAEWPEAARIDVAAIPNNHLQYALTWYGLAVVLMAMTWIRWRTIRRERHG